MTNLNMRESFKEHIESEYGCSISDSDINIYHVDENAVWNHQQKKIDQLLKENEELKKKFNLITVKEYEG